MGKGAESRAFDPPALNAFGRNETLTKAIDDLGRPDAEVAEMMESPQAYEERFTKLSNEEQNSGLSARVVGQDHTQNKNDVVRIFLSTLMTALGCAGIVIFIAVAVIMCFIVAMVFALNHRY